MNGIMPLVERVCDVVDPISAGFIAGLLAVAVGTINLLCRRWLTAGQMGLMWGLVLVRLLIPVAPSSPLSLENLLVVIDDATMVEQSESSRPSEASVAPANSSMDGGLTQSVAAQPPIGSASADRADEFPWWLELLFESLPGVWLFCGLAGLAWTLANYWRFCRRVSRSGRCEDQRLLQLWAACCKRAGVTRTGSIVLVEGMGQPAIMGVFRRTLLLPSDASELADEQLRMIMFHELAHVRRWDIAANWVLVAIRAIHWWNPVYWLAAARFRSLREQACDAFVIRQSESKSIHGYSALLLELAQKRPAVTMWRVMLPASILGFFPSLFRNRAVRVRLKALRTGGAEHGWWHTVGVAVVVMLVGACGLTDARTTDSAADMPSWTNAPVRGLDVQPESFVKQQVYSGPRVTRTYDIALVLDRFAEEPAAIGPAEYAKPAFEATLKLMFHAKVEPDSGTAAEEDAEQTDADRSQMTYSIDGDTLSVSAAAELQETLGRTLDAWTKGGLSQIAVSSQIISTKSDLVSKLGFSWQYVEAFSSQRPREIRAEDGGDMPIVRVESRVDNYVPVLVTTIDSRQAKMLIDAAQGDRRTNVLNAPKVTLFNSQSASIVDCVQRPFVVGLRQRSVGVEKKVVTVDEGSKITLRAVQGRDRKKVHLEESLNFSQVEGVTTTSISSSGQPVTIEIPHVNRCVVDVATDIEDAHSLLVACLPTDNKHEYRYYLLTVNVLKDERLSTMSHLLDLRTN